LNKAKNSSLEKKRESTNFNTYTKLFQQNVKMEKIKVQEMKKSSRNILRNNKSIKFEITRVLFQNYFCGNTKDIIIVEKLFLFLEPLLKSKKLIIPKSEESINEKKSNETEQQMDLSLNTKDLVSRGRKMNKEIKQIEINLESGKETNNKKLRNGRYGSNSNKQQDDNRDLSKSNDIKNKDSSKRKRRNKIESCSRSHSLVIGDDINEINKSNEQCKSKNINEQNINTKKKRKKPKKKFKEETRNNLNEKNENLSEDKSYISDDNIEKNKLNFFNILKNVTTNMLLESKIKGESVECLIEPQVIPNLDKILADPISKTQRNIEKNKPINKNMELSNDDYDYNNISDNSQLYIKKRSNIILNNNPIKDINKLEFLDKQSNRVQNNFHDNEKIKNTENEIVNKSININALKLEEKTDQINNINKSNNANQHLSDRSGIYRINDNSNMIDLSKENRLDFASTNDKNDKKKNLNSNISNIDNGKKNIIVINDDSEKNNKNSNEKENLEIKNEDIVLNEKSIRDKINVMTEKTNELNNYENKGSIKTNIETSNKILNKENKNILNKKKKEACNCACSIF